MVSTSCNGIERKMEILFIFTALLPCLWLVMLILSWLDYLAPTSNFKADCEAAKKIQSSYANKVGIINQLSKFFLFLIPYSVLLYPIRGMIIAVSLLALFIFINKHFV
jgi:hypothetical protein